MCDWGGGPNSAASYTDKGVEKGMISKREEEEERQERQKRPRYIRRTQIILILDKKEFVVAGKETDVDMVGLTSAVESIVNS